MNRLRHAGRRRLAALRAEGTADDGGFALIFVMLVATLIMIGTASMLAVAAGNVLPAKKSQDNENALAAAQAGLQYFLAQLNAQCADYSINNCQWLASNPTVPTIANPLPTGVPAFTVTAQNPLKYLSDNNAVLRVRSSATSGSATRVLTADIDNKPSALQFAYLSRYETLASDLLDSIYGARTIKITDSSVASALGVPVGTTVTWNGTAATGASGYSDKVCNNLFYDDPTNTAVSGGASGPGRSTIESAEQSLPDGADYSESGTLTKPIVGSLVTTSSAVTRYAPCQVAFSKNEGASGPVYSTDAILMSNGDYTNPAGPSFVTPSTDKLGAIQTGWSPSKTPMAGALYRSFGILGGTPSAGAVVTSPYALALPTAANPSTVTCTYSGPTRIVLSGSNAVVTSPLTAAGSTPCTSGGTSGSGVAGVTVPIATTTINVVDSTATTSLPLFGLYGGGSDRTAYSVSRGDAYVQGSLSSGKLSLVAQHDIVVTDNVTTTSTSVTNGFGEPSWQSGAAIDLVAVNNVRIYHPVSCKSADDGTTSAGFCANDATGLYTTNQSNGFIGADGALKATHPSLQYCNLPASSFGSCSSQTDQSATREIDAAVFALNGSLVTDNFMRGHALGTVKVVGGLYQLHRGATGQEWAVPATQGTTRRNSGYRLQLQYQSLQYAGLPYVPSLQTGTRNRPWTIKAISTSGGGS